MKKIHDAITLACFVWCGIMTVSAGNMILREANEALDDWLTK